MEKMTADEALRAITPHATAESRAREAHRRGIAIRDGYNPPPRNAKRPDPPPAPPAPPGQCPAPADHAIADRARAELASLEMERVTEILMRDEDWDNCRKEGALRHEERIDLIDAEINLLKRIIAGEE